MSIPYTESGRTRQKQRTRSALVEAARKLVREGIAPTVEETAAAADISRTTAYRYFQNQRELIAAAYPMIDDTSLLDDDAPADAEERLRLVLDHHLALTLAHESAIRATLWLSLKPRQPEPSILRQGRAVGWILDALAPLQGKLAAAELERLARAIRATAGIEPLIWLTDIARMSREEAVEVMTWSAVALLRQAIADAG